MVHFPFEIWEEIALYLSDGLLWYYRHLNSAFYNVALERRYRTILPCFEDLQPGKQWYDFWGFRNHDMAKRVRNILFQSQAGYLGKLLRRDQPTKLPGYVKQKIQKLFNPNPEPYRSIVKTTRSFVNVSSIALQTSSAQLSPNSLSIFNTTLITCARTLTSLTLETSLECLTKVLKPDLFLPHLTALKISPPPTLHSSVQTRVFPAESAGVIVPFLKRHRLTLTRLNLLVETDTNGSSPFTGLDCMTSLTNIHIKIRASSGRNGHQHIRQFIETLSSNLQTLSIDVDDSHSYQSISRSFKAITGSFNDLQHLSISHFSKFSPPIQGVEALDLVETANFIRGISGSLVTLSLSTTQTMDTFYHLFNLREGTGNSYTRLRYLSIAFPALTPEIMDVLVAHTPILQDLRISAERLKPRHDAPDEFDDESQFCDEMLQRDYRHWKLKRFMLFDPQDRILANEADIGISAFSYGGRFDLENRLGKAAIAVVIPSLEAFNRVSWKEYVSEGPLAHLLG